MQKKNCSKKKIENYALNLKQTCFFFLIRMIISENSLNEYTQKKGLETSTNMKFHSHKHFFA